MSDEIDLEAIIRDRQFTEHQRQEPLFQNIFKESLAKQVDEILNPRLAEMTPRFEVRNGILYRMDKGRGGEEILQILVAHQYWTKMLKVAHTFPMGGHLGSGKIEAHLKQSVLAQLI